MTPAMPHFTCKKIDEVIEFLNDAKAYAEDDDFGSAKVQDLQALYDHIADGTETIKLVMEEIREANHDLRTIATHQEEQIENHDALVEELRDEIESLKRETRMLT